jgi:hypothetical protein
MVRVASSESTSWPSPVVPMARAVLVMEPASRSSWVMVYSFRQSRDPPGSRDPQSMLPIRESLTDTASRATPPVLVSRKS